MPVKCILHYKCLKRTGGNQQHARHGGKANVTMTIRSLVTRILAHGRSPKGKTRHTQLCSMVNKPIYRITVMQKLRQGTRANDTLSAAPGVGTAALRTRTPSRKSARLRTTSEAHHSRSSKKCLILTVLPKHLAM